MNKYLTGKLNGKEIHITYVSGDLKWVLATYDTENHRGLFKLNASDLNMEASKLEKLVDKYE